MKRFGKVLEKIFHESVRNPVSSVKTKICIQLRSSFAFLNADFLETVFALFLTTPYI